MTLKSFSVRHSVSGALDAQLGADLALDSDHVKELSEPLRNGLWNVILARLFGKVGANGYGEITQEYHIFIALHRHFFKLPMDELEKHLGSRREWYKDAVFAMDGARLFDLFEFVARRMIPYDAGEWERDTNAVFESEGIPLRVVAGSILSAPEGSTWESLKESLKWLQAQQDHELPGAAASELKAALSALALRPEPDLSSVGISCRRAVALMCSYVDSTDPLPTSSKTGEASAQGEAPGKERMSFLRDSKSCRPEWLRSAAQQVFLDAAEETVIDGESAHALVGLTAMLLAALLRQAGERGVRRVAEPQPPRPSAPDPWGERHLLVDRSRE